MSYFKSLWLLIPVLSLVFTIPSSAAFGAAPCASPLSGAGVTVLPNVLTIFDNSGSMKGDAYREVYNIEKTYHGIFDPTKRYNYSSEQAYFYEASEGDWSGNFLNWCTMTRIDLARSILTGGAVKTEGSDKYLFLNVEASGSEYDHRYDDGIIPYQTPFHGQGELLYYTSDADAGDWCAKFRVAQGGTTLATYRMRIKLAAESDPTGFIHNLEGKVRLGRMYFNVDPNDTSIVEGGHVSTYVKKLDAAHLNDLVVDLNRNFVDPGSWSTYNCTDATCEKSTWTPLAESLYSAVRYFKQESPYYYSSDYTLADASNPWRDPLYQEDYQQKIWCAKNYIILITDGQSTQDLNIPAFLRDYDGDGCDPKPGAGCGYSYDWNDPCANPFECGNTTCGDVSCTYPDPISCNSTDYGTCGSGYLDDVAYYAHTQDLRSDLSNDQTITLHTIYIFGQPGVADTLLQKAAEKGGGDYYAGQDADQITTAFENIFEEIVQSATSASSVAVTSQATSNDSRVFIPYYKHPAEYEWRGNIRAFDLDVNGNIIDAGGAVATDVDADGIYDNPVWDAALKVKEKADIDSRSIFTFIAGSKVDFSTLQASTIGPYFDVDFDGDAIKDESNEVNALISYIRGNDSPPGGFSLRGRNEHYLGDIINAQPVFSGKPFTRFDVIYGDSSYWDFYWANTSRTEALFAGANDGMLHAFNAGTGEEMWAYIPFNLLAHLQWLADPSYCHVFYVDLGSRIWEVKLGAVWTSLLLGGMRIGGTPIDVDTDDDDVVDTTFRSAYFALDVTDPTNPVVKWEINDARFGYTTSKPIAVKVQDSWYIVFGSGPKTRDGKGYSTADGYTDTNGYIFVVNASDGSIVRTLSVGTRGANNFFGSPVAVDYDLDYNVDVIYIGDAKGNLWRIKTFTGSGVSKSYYGPSGWITDVATDNPSAADPNPLLSLSPVDADQPILMKPAVALDGSGRLWVYVGTGRYFCANDNVCCGEGVDCPPDAVGGSCPAGNGCSVTEGGEVRSKYMAVGVFDRYWDSGSSEYVLATSTITLADLDHRITVSGPLTGAPAITGYAVVDDQYPSQDIATNICATCKGWYFRVLEDRERCLGDFLVYRAVVFFLTYKPETDAGDPCSGGGTSNLYGVYYTSGTSTITPVFDLTGEGTVDQGDTVTISAGRAVGGTIVRVERGFAGGSPVALGELLYLPLGMQVPISLPGEPYKTGVTSWKEVWD